MSDPNDRLAELQRIITELEEKYAAQAAALRQMRPAAPGPSQDEPLAAIVRRLKLIRMDLDAQIAYFDALLAAWGRQHAAGEVASLPELTRRVRALEERFERLERGEGGRNA